MNQDALSLKKPCFETLDPKKHISELDKIINSFSNLNVEASNSLNTIEMKMRQLHLPEALECGGLSARKTVSSQGEDEQEELQRPTVIERFQNLLSRYEALNKRLSLLAEHAEKVI